MTRKIILSIHSVFGLLVFAIMVVLSCGVDLLLKGDTSFGIKFIVFGGLFLLTLQKDVRKYLHFGPSPGKKHGNVDWYFEHLNRMGISFIAAVTAFTSIQNVFKYNLLNFLLPTILALRSLQVPSGGWRRS